MASFVDMSLEDIIKKRKEQAKMSKTSNANKTPKTRPTVLNSKNAISDARNLIISKKRNQIVDARERLAELAKHRDARLKLEHLRLKKMTMVRNLPPRDNRTVVMNNWARTISNKEKGFFEQTRQIRSQPRPVNVQIHTQQHRNTRRFMDAHTVGVKGSEPRPLITRTVENDIIKLDDGDDPMGEEYMPRSKHRHSLSRNASLSLKIVAHNNDIRGKPGLIRRTIHQEKAKSPPRLTSILKKRPMASLRNNKKPEIVEEPPVSEYRIIVSNLRNTVTASDIEELFGDIGGMIESRLVRPGTGEVVYKTLADAQRAVELYHNRQLDNQPMNCLLVAPRTSKVQPKVSSTQSLPPSSNSNVEPDISTFHKVLFSNY